MEDLGIPNETEEAEHNYNKFIKLWEAEVAAKGLKDASCFDVLLKFIGLGQLIYCLSLIACATVCKVLSPMVSKWLIQSLEGSVQHEVWVDWLLVALLFLLPACSGTFESHQMLQAKRLSQNLYAALTTAIFRKSLVISPHARAQASTGRIVTLMSNDAGTGMEQVLVQCLPLFVALPQLIVVMVLLGFELGASIVGGLGVAVVAMPLSITVMRNVAYYQQRYSEMMDRRMKLVNDMLSGIRVVKAYSWESAFLEVIGGVREREIGVVKRHGYWTLLGLSTIFMQVPTLMMMVTVILFVHWVGDVSPSRIFPVLQLFVLAQQPLQGIPSAINAFVNLNVAQTRIGQFMKLAEVEIDTEDTRVLVPAQPGEDALQFREANYAWAPPELEEWQADLPKSRVEMADEAKKAAAATEEAPAEVIAASKEGIEQDKAAPPAEEAKLTLPADETQRHPSFSLTNLNLNIPAGSLVAVVGAVGSGKSSLLSAILNEMHKTSGAAVVRGTVAYASQQAWIQNHTLRGNILLVNEILCLEELCQHRML